MDQIEISLTRFISFTALNPDKRVQFVRDLKYEGPYEFKNDFWGPFRQGIVTFHKHNKPESYLDELVRKASPKRKDLYKLAVEKYKEFVAKNGRGEYFESLSRHYHYKNLHINVNPEFGLIIKKKPHLVKLYCTEDGVDKKLDSGKAKLIYNIMHKALDAELGGRDLKFSIMNVRAGTLNRETKRESDFLETNLKVHLDTFIQIWDLV